MITTITAFLLAHWITILGWTWAISGGIHWINHHDDVKLQPQKFVYNFLCGPIVWGCQFVGIVIDFLDWTFDGFKKWLYKKEEKK